MKRQNITTSLILTILISCGPQSENICNDSIFENSSLICLSEKSDGYNVQIRNPWKQNTLLHSYDLSFSKETNYSFSKTHSTIHIPLKKVVVMTNSHSRLMVELGLVNNIGGICELQYISDSTINRRCNDGIITDCGNGLYPNIEKIIELRPDAILVSPFEDTGYEQLEKLGIPLIECADYMETSPLARAEWMRFYGRLFSAATQADSLFTSVCTRYKNLTKITSLIRAKRPTVMLDTRGGSAWYIAGGKSTVGQMINDAGGDYIFSSYEKSGSIPLSFETVYEKAHNADIWLLKNSSSKPLTYSQLANDYSLYKEFKPFETKNIWVCDVNKVPYFENTSFHPESLLEDFINIFHPGLLENYTSLYYHPLDSD